MNVTTNHWLAELMICHLC